MSFEISDGNIVGFLGPNGAGKTTTMRLLTGFLSPDKGTVFINGINVNENPKEAQKQIGYLPENNPLYDDMLVSDFLELSMDLQNIPKEKRKKALDFVVSAMNIGSVYYRPIKELSKGFKQRVGIGACLLHEPKIIIMDEPTEGLDPNQRQEIRSLVKNLAKDRTIILSTHVMAEAKALCDKMLIINNGSLVAQGTSEELSNLARKEKILLLELEGSNIESLLRNLTGISKLEVEHTLNNRLKAKIFIPDSTFQIQPVISRLICENRWVVWKMVEEEYGLEDIFHKLTLN